MEDLEKCQYTYKATHGQIGIIGPMIREIHLLDITVPEQNLNELLKDLAPFIKPGASKQKNTALFVKKALWLAGKVSALFKGTRLRPIPSVMEGSGRVRKQPLNIMPLFWFEDPVLKNHAWVLPKKGEGGEAL